MMNTLILTFGIIGLVCGGIALLHVCYALLWLPIYLLGGRHPK